MNFHTNVHSMMNELLDDVEDFMATWGLTASRFGREALRDPQFVYRLRGGSQCLPRTVARVQAYMADYSQKRRKSGGA